MSACNMCSATSVVSSISSQKLLDHVEPQATEIAICTVSSLFKDRGEGTGGGHPQLSAEDGVGGEGDKGGAVSG